MPRRTAVAEMLRVCIRSRSTTSRLRSISRRVVVMVY